MPHDEHQEQKDSARHFYDRISHVYDAISEASEGRCRDRALELLAAKPGERILEVGYGTGHAMVALARAVGREGAVVGLDVSSGMERETHKRLEDAGLLERADLRVEGAPPLPFPDETFDAAFLGFTLELFAPEVIPEVLAELRRVLRPGGRLGVVAMAEVPEGKSESLMERGYKWMHRHFPHIVDCEPIAAEAVVEAAGFRLEHRERVNLFTMPVAMLVGVKPSG